MTRPNVISVQASAAGPHSPPLPDVLSPVLAPFQSSSAVQGVMKLGKAAAQAVAVCVAGLSWSVTRKGKCYGLIQTPRPPGQQD